MKYILAFVLTLSFTHAFAGGQTGSGMNGCWTRNSNGIREWRSIEEIMYPEMILKGAKTPARGYDISPQWFYIQNTRYTDLTKKYYAKRALNRMELIIDGQPRSFHIFKELIKLFSHVQVSTFSLRGIYQGEVSKRHAVCRDFSPAMLTFKNGTIVVFKPVFEKLDSVTAEILYIHETIRFAQTYHPAFQDLTDSDLQKLTSLFFTNRPEKRKFDEILKKFEERLVSGSYKVGPPKPDTSLGTDTEKMFRAKFQEALFYDEEILGTVLNEFRVNDTDFKEKSYEEITRYLQSARSTKIIDL